MSRIQLLLKNKKVKSVLRIASLLFFLFAMSIPQYFIWSDLFIQEFDADVAESELR